MVNKYSLWGVIVGGVVSIIVLLFLFWWMFLKVSYVVYSEDTVINADFVVTEEQPVLLRDNAKLTVKGDAVLAGELACKKGGVHLEVEGLLSVASEINCDTDPEEAGVDASGVTLVASGGLVLGPESVINSQGSVQIVDSTAKVASTQAGVDNIFDSIENDDQTGLQIGPLTNDLADSTFASPTQEAASTSKLPFVATAHAQTEEPEGGAADIDELINRIDKSNDLTDKEKEALFLFMMGFGESILSSGKALSKNNERYRFVQRYVETKETNDLKDFFAGLVIKPSLAEEFSEAIDEYLQAEDRKLPVIISGKISVGDGEEPPERIDVEELIEKQLPPNERPKKVVLNFDFSDGQRGVLLSGLTIQGPHGVAASSGMSPDCTVVGDNGGNALRFNARAHNLRVGNLTLAMGDGGDGGSVTNSPFCENASVKGGNGGKPGNIRMRATGSFKVFGELQIIPGVGGFGGMAKAQTAKAANACPGIAGGNAEAVGGRGGDSMQRLRIRGTIGGVGLITVAPAFGGDGGNAFAEANIGGDGEKCGCAGGKGGNATATGGAGGDAAPSEDGKSEGGQGGDAIAVAGDAGHGGHCKKDEGPAGNGGPGGDAVMTPGKGGTGDIPGKAGGDKSEALAGDGGDGGDGCPAGDKGKGSTIGKAGIDGGDGIIMCSKKKEPEKDPLISIGGTNPGSMYEIEVIPFKGSGIPKFLVREAGPDECKGDHWHGSGMITMINGEKVEDPARDGCGFGETSEVKAIWVPVDHQKMKELYGDSVEQYLRPTMTVSNEADQEVTHLEVQNRGTSQETTTEVKLDGGIFAGESLGQVESDPLDECTLVEFCQVGFGGFAPCPGTEDEVARNKALGCPGYETL